MKNQKVQFRVALLCRCGLHPRFTHFEDAFARTAAELLFGSIPFEAHPHRKVGDGSFAFDHWIMGNFCCRKPLLLGKILMEKLWFPVKLFQEGTQ